MNAKKKKHYDILPEDCEDIYMVWFWQCVIKSMGEIHTLAINGNLKGIKKAEYEK